MNREKQHRVGLRLRRANGKSQTGFTHIEENTTTGKEEITEKKDVEDACNDKKMRKLPQTSNTPLMHG